MENKKNAAAFYKMAYEGNLRDAVDRFVGDVYIQHNPAVEDGKEGFIEYFERMSKKYPKKSIEFVRVIAEGNLVALHTHQTWPENDEYVTMDFFRFNENGKIVEHWDSMKKIPEKSANGNNVLDHHFLVYFFPSLLTCSYANSIHFIATLELEIFVESISIQPILAPCENGFIALCVMVSSCFSFGNLTII